jgi:ribosomal protein L40E
MDIQTKKCPKCFTDISVKATKCPNCQSDIRSKKVPKFVLGLFVFSMFVFIISLSMLSEPAPYTKTISTADPIEWVGIYAQVYVKETLKAPSTAKFPVIRDNNVTDLGNGRYRVLSYVDSQNSFGAMIRSDWEVTLIYKGSNAEDAGSWDIQEIVIGGKVVFKK